MSRFSTKFSQLVIIGVLFTLVSGFLPRPLFAQEDLASKIDAVIERTEYKQARWGILIADAKTGKPIYSHNPDKLATPASVTKLFTCATAMIVLGPDWTAETPVYAHGEMSTSGTLNGDLILVAAGDLSFGGRRTKDGKSSFVNNDHTYANSGLMEAELTKTDPLLGIQSLARQVKEAGIQEITGEVLIDDRLFEHTRGSGSGPDAVTPILVNDNVVDVVIEPGDMEGAPAKVKLVPETQAVQVDIQIRTVAEVRAPVISLRALGSNRFTIQGHIPLKHAPLVRILPVEDPAHFARGLFIEALRREEIRVSASPLSSPSNGLPDRQTLLKGKPIASFRSDPLAETLKVTLKVSHNLYASTLPSLVASQKNARSAAVGLRRQREILDELGVDVDTISFGGGAGGAMADAVTPQATVKLLHAMSKRPEWKAYKECLPILGVDGTLATVVPKSSPARGKFMAKTGTLIWGDVMNGRFLLRSKALAGVGTTAKGTEVLLAMFVNDVPLAQGVTSTREGKVLGEICEIIHAHGP